MAQMRGTRMAADIALAYAADESGAGVAYAAISTGSSTAVIRLTFAVSRAPALDGLELGYAAVAVLGACLKTRGVNRVRIRLADGRVAADLGGLGAPPKALAMSYVKIRCALNGLGKVRLECAETADIRDLAARAKAEVNMHVAA